MDRMDSTVMNSINTTQNNTLTDGEKDDYDSQGAMLFIIAVIVVYGVAVICMLGFYHGREVHLEDFDKQADSFLKEVDDRHRQLDIRSRKSVFTKRLSELRSELSHDQPPLIQSHVANYLIASIGMKSKRKKRSLSISPFSFKRKSTSSSRRHSGQSLPSSSASVLNTDGNSKYQIPIVRITDNNRKEKRFGEQHSSEIKGREPCLPNPDIDATMEDSKRSYISMQDNSIEDRSAQELLYISKSVESVFTSDSRLTRLKQNFIEIFDCTADDSSSQMGSGYLLHSSRKAVSRQKEECEGLILLEYETVV